LGKAYTYLREWQGVDVDLVLFGGRPSGEGKR